MPDQDDVVHPEEQTDFTPVGQQFKYCPMCQTELVYRHVHDRLRQQCPVCHWIHFQDPKVGAGVLIEQDGQILLGKRGIDPGKGLWCFPSGFVEIDETPEIAAIRECKEETGLNVEITDLFGVYPFVSRIKGAGVLILYRCQIVGGELAASDDLIEVAFFGPASLPAEEEWAFASNREALHRWKACLENQE
ncbi:MAG: NUDIX hydrolase [Chloroflexota bacterium]